MFTCLLIDVFVCLLYCVAPLAVSRPPEPSKPPESKATLETDDYKAKKNRECFRTGAD